MNSKCCLSLCLVGLIELSGCANTPDVSRSYYLPVVQQDIAIVQTIGCKMKNGKGITGPYSTAVATVTTSYVADYSVEHSFTYKAVDNSFGDSDISVGVTDDGRLTALNAAGVGEGAAIIKAAATVASIDTGNKIQRNNELQSTPDCTVIGAHGSASDKSANISLLTVNYKLRVQYRFAEGATHTQDIQVQQIADDGAPLTMSAPYKIPLNSGANPLDDETLGPLTQIPFTLKVTPVPGKYKLQPILSGEQPSDCATAPDRKDKPGVLCVPGMGQLNVELLGPPADLVGKATSFYKDQILAPSTTPHELPVPKAPTFGKMATTAQFGPSGIVEKLEYNKASALSDLISSGAQIYSQTKPETTAEKEAEVQAESDLIYQTQRHTACLLDAQTCSQK
ncbi:hypothetical protein R75465_05999 [Paraburkholderia aspalathi]|uniref:hypothetical protein n=1 Tax=Paraburkholderia aspalathi TaxID=1324617 RepID=UPI001B037714|nr:hypothetical protein [Paraburkholderia aspalathi]CAE6824791.1 hypothetical protein R75465_05999 [Paraburkholderia aspalathi]